MQIQYFKQKLLLLLQDIVAIESEEDFDEILNSFSYKKFSKNQVVLNNGNICKEFYFIVTGCMRVFFVSEQGNEKTNHIAFENSIITAMSSFITQTPSFENIDVLEDAEVLILSNSDFYKLVQTNKIWQTCYVKILEKAYITKVKRIENRITLQAKQRYDVLMKENPYIFTRISNHIIASYLDMSQETLSRLKSM